MNLVDYLKKYLFQWIIVLFLCYCVLVVPLTSYLVIVLPKVEWLVSLGIGPIALIASVIGIYVIALWLVIQCGKMFGLDELVKSLSKIESGKKRELAVKHDGK